MKAYKYSEITPDIIYKALEELKIPKTREGLKVPGLRYIVYKFITTGNKYEAMYYLKTSFNDKLSRDLPETYHQFFTQTAEIYKALSL